MINVPPLAERREDIIPIIDKIISDTDRPHVTLKPDCMAFLESYDWPLNVRQLKTTIQSMVALTRGDFLCIGDIPKDILAGVVHRSTLTIPDTKTSGDDVSISCPRELPLEQAMRIFESTFIQLRFCYLPGVKNISALAAALRVPRTTMARKLQDLGINMTITDQYT